MLDEMEKVKEAQRLVEITAQAVHDSRETYHRLASDFDEAEGASNEGLGCRHKLIPEMTTATSATLIGTGDRSENEQDYLKKAVVLLNKVLNEEDREGQREIAAVGSPRRSWRSNGEGETFESWRRRLRRSSRSLTGIERRLWQ